MKHQKKLQKIYFSWKGRKSFDDLWMRLLIDASFWILFTVIGLNVVTSLILDGFRQLKVCQLHLPAFQTDSPNCKEVYSGCSMTLL
jgi:hypothetical protein